MVSRYSRNNGTVKWNERKTLRTFIAAISVKELLTAYAAITLNTAITTRTLEPAM
jgi:hypothetical protein